MCYSLFFTGECLRKEKGGEGWEEVYQEPFCGTNDSSFIWGNNGCFGGEWGGGKGKKGSRRGSDWIARVSFCGGYKGKTRVGRNI